VKLQILLTVRKSRFVFVSWGLLLPPPLPDYKTRRLFLFKVLKNMTRLVQGVGFNDGIYPAQAEGRILKEYTLWSSLLKRCYSSKYQQGKPTYVGCSASENFKSYSFFHEWCQNQIGFGEKGFELDKDLLLRGNKVYSEAVCVFVPKRLNTLLLSSKDRRGNLPIGVSAEQGKFKAKCCTDTSPYIGYFDTPELAFQAYKRVKESYIKFRAEQWRESIDPRAYMALMNYEVLITD